MACNVPSRAGAELILLNVEPSLPVLSERRAPKMVTGACRSAARLSWVKPMASDVPNLPEKEVPYVQSTAGFR